MKSRIFKKLSSLFVASTLLFCLGTSVVSASTTSEISPKAMICGDCRNGVMLEDTIKRYGDWIYLGQVKCSHKAYGTDLKYQKTVDTRLRCTNCGYTSYYEFSHYEYKYECRGSNG